MKIDMEDLKFSIDELERLTGKSHLTVSVEQLLELYVVYEKSPDMFATLQASTIVIRPSMLHDPEFRKQLSRKLYEKSLGKQGWLGKGLNTLTKTIEKKIDRYLQSFQPTPLGSLLDDVERFNKVIDGIVFVDRLQDAGHSVTIHERKYIIERLQQIRAELVRAPSIKTKLRSVKAQL